MVTIPIRNNPITQAFDLRVADTIEIGYIPPIRELLFKGKTKLERLVAQLESLEIRLADVGFYPKFEIVEKDFNLYTIPLIIAPYLYFVDWAPNQAARRRCERVTAMHEWCENNCSDSYHLNQTGVTFSSEEDAVLWRICF